jgi:hypothetical protein
MYTKDEPWQTCNLMSDTTSIVFDLSLYLCRLSIEICAIAMCQSQWTSEHGLPGMCGEPCKAKPEEKNSLPRQNLVQIPPLSRCTRAFWPP